MSKYYAHIHYKIRDPFDTSRNQATRIQEEINVWPKTYPPDFILKLTMQAEYSPHCNILANFAQVLRDRPLNAYAILSLHEIPYNMLIDLDYLLIS